MNEQQRQRWAKTRQWGSVRFVLFCVIAWGVPMGLMCSTLLYGILLWAKSTQPELRYTQLEASYLELFSWWMPIALVGGVGFGVTVWRRAEREFNDVPTVSPWESPLHWAAWSGILFALATMFVCVASVPVLGIPFQTKDGGGVLYFAQFAVPTAGLVGAVVGFVLGRRRHLSLYSPDKTKIPPEVS